MSRLPALTPTKVIRALERAGFVFVRQKGSHRIYMKGAAMVVVPFHRKDIRIGTLKSIVKYSRLSSLAEFIDLL